MSLIDELPESVTEVMRSDSIANYVTVSRQGMPVDTPILYFPKDDLSHLDLATGLSYPVKAERARRNPKAGLLLSGLPHEPVISVSGMAAVRDADLQRNVLRYLAEASHTLPGNPGWELARHAVWYWTRIIIEITPARIDWWDNPASMDRKPHTWLAPEGMVYPQSDPAPPGRTSSAAKWQELDWRTLAKQALDRNVPGQLSVLDSDGFPRPIGATGITITETGFTMALPRGLSWEVAGKACLTFGGLETFLGEACGAEGQAEFKVHRTLPVFPMTQDMSQLWEPTEHTRAELMRRLEEELQRRGQPLPSIPVDRPAPSEGYRRRMERMKAASAAAQ